MYISHDYERLLSLNLFFLLLDSCTLFCEVPLFGCRWCSFSRLWGSCIFRCRDSSVRCRYDIVVTLWNVLRAFIAWLIHSTQSFLCLIEFS